MSGDVHVQFCERPGVRFPRATHPVVGLHHRVGEKHLPLDGADRENRASTVVRELAEPVGEVAFPLPAQPRDPMRGDIVEEVFRKIDTPVAVQLRLPEMG